MLFKLLIFIILFFTLNFSFAEGSKDLYPAGAQGSRAWLYSGLYSSFALPFPTQGEHYVYVNSGEWISMATSFQGLNNSTIPLIELFDPSGNPVTLNFSNATIGKIPNRLSELSGPHFPSQSATGNQYNGVYFQASTSGIYKVLLKTNASALPTYTGNIGNFGANGNWVQSTNTNLLAAWDVSVCDASQTNWISGRVYYYNVVMEMPMSTQSPYNGGLYTKLKVLTKDGFVYNVNTNGQNGIAFSFMVNSRGFHQPNQPDQPIYKSINISGQSSQWIAARYHDPRLPDDQFTTTHKIFYNIPDINMPATAIGGQAPGQNTWLFNQQPASINNLSFIGAETTPNQIATNKGGYILFNSSNGGNYTITISPAIGTQTYTTRVINGIASVGTNQIYFDGKDGNGLELPVGASDVKIEFNLGEVHFPFFDMELNPNGIIIERYNQTFTSIESDTVFWNDYDIPLVNTYGGPNANPTVNLSGISSNLNGHKWGYDNYPTYNWSGQGDNMGMDTWTYLKSPSSSQIQIFAKKADLKVNITADKNDCDIQTGDEITYTVKIKNNGPSDVNDAKFSFVLSTNLSDANQTNFNNGSCGSEAQTLTFNGISNTYSSLLNLPNGCEVTYTIKAVVTTSGLTNSLVIANILRPNDVNDPDATNPTLLDTNNNPYQPTDTQEECINNAPSFPNGCNNSMNQTIHHVPTISIVNGSVHNPNDCSQNGEFSLIFTGVTDGNYTLTYNGGTFLNVTITNGKATISNLSAGSYNNISISNGFCSSTSNLNVSLTGQGAPNVLPIQNQTFCSGDTISFIAFDGTQDATFKWSNNNTSIGLNSNGVDTIYSFQGINNGTSPIVATITITPEKDGCIGENKTFTITIDPIPTVEITIPNNPICSGKNVVLTAVGSPTNGSYSWNNGLGNSSSLSISPTTTTDYFVNYNLNGCDVFDTITVNIKQPVEPIFNDFDTICYGKTITLPAISNNNISGTWSPTMNPNSSTIYTFTPTSNECAASIQKTLNVREKLELEINKTDVSCSGTLGEANVTALNTESKNTYLWSTGSDSSKIISLATGVYTVTVTDTFGCENIASTEILIDNTLEIGNIQIPNVITTNDDQINDYFELPYLNNPCVTIKIDILNRWGNNVYEMSNNNTRFEGKNFNGEKLSDGIYFYRIISKELGCTNSNNANCHGFIHIINK